MKKKKKIMIIAVLLILCLSVLAMIINRPKLKFNQKNLNIEINSEFDPKDNIKNISKIDENKLTIDSSSLDLTKLGTYNIDFLYEKKTYSYQVNVVDTICPEFETVAKSIEINEIIDPNDLVTNIIDKTQTTVYLKEAYTFDTIGDKTVIVVVEDEGKNKTEKEVIITILPPDTTAPTINGANDIKIKVGNSINYLKNITVSDDRDPNPTIEVISDQVNIYIPGTYPLIYKAYDKAGNISTIEKKVIVEELPIPSGDKVIYLTFDDGPANNTIKVLDILNRYNVKATFFVTGARPQYNYLIKEAYNQGHTIGLHTYSHNYASLYSSVEAYFNDLNKVGEVVKNQIGFIPKFIRFPGGSSNTVSKNYSLGIMSKLVNEVHNRGYEYYDWNVTSGDANGNNIPVNTIIKESTSSNANQIMLLFHDIDTKNTTVEALPTIIEYYRNRGYRFEGISNNSYICHHGVNN